MKQVSFAVALISFAGHSQASNMWYRCHDCPTVVPAKTFAPAAVPVKTTSIITLHEAMIAADCKVFKDEENEGWMCPENPTNLLADCEKVDDKWGCTKKRHDLHENNREDDGQDN